MQSSLSGKHILLIISGSVAAYKSLELVRLLRQHGATISSILTKGGKEFVTPLSLGALSEGAVYESVFSLKDEQEMGHIRLAREADAIVIYPASADMLARMAQGLADDLATTCLLAANASIFAAPAMNPHMWAHAATQRNVAQLASDGVHMAGPASGLAACGEEGAGRLIEPTDMFEQLKQHFSPRSHMPKHSSAPLLGKRVIVTAGPTLEAIDPVRFLSNHSSGKQGYAIANALHAAGAHVSLISGPVHQKANEGVDIIPCLSADDMLMAVEDSLPADIFIGTAAVSDWRPSSVSTGKIKKNAKNEPPQISLTENTDILHHVANHPQKRPQLVIGFAAETAGSKDRLARLARLKRQRKGCDWIFANDVSQGRVFGDDQTQLLWGNETGQQFWPACSKLEAAQHIVAAIIQQRPQATIHRKESYERHTTFA